MQETVQTLKDRAVGLSPLTHQDDVLWLGPSQSPFRNLEADGGLTSTIVAAGISAVGEAVVLVEKVWRLQLRKVYYLPLSYMALLAVLPILCSVTLPKFMAYACRGNSRLISALSCAGSQ